MAAGRKLLLWCAAAAGLGVSPALADAGAAGSCSAHDQSGCGKAAADHVLLQLADANRVSRAGGVAGPARGRGQTEEGCRTTEPGEQCYAAVEWAMTHGIKMHPEWYPELNKESSFEEFQAFLAGKDLEDCPRPCDLCHTAAEGEDCYTAVSWAMEHGIKQHPEWYIGLTYGASFEEFQAHLHLGGIVVNGKPHASCPMPCNLCRTVSEANEPCYTDLKWAMQHGIKIHPEWYPGLNENSTKVEFQGFLNTQGMCPTPCGQCHTAVKGERCYTGVEWAMAHGIKLHPEWYPDLTKDSTFEEFQQHLHDGKYEQCPQPCRP